MQSYLPYLANLAVSVIFGFSFLFTKEALHVLTPFQLLGFRFATAALVLTGLRAVRVVRIEYENKPVRKLLLLAAFQPLLYFTCENIGVKLTSASEAGMMIALVPVVSALLGTVFLKEHPIRVQWFFILLSVSGVLLIIFMQGATVVDSNIRGVLILLGAVLAAGVFNILSRQNSLEFRPLEITFVMMWVGAVFFNVLGLGQAVLEGVSFKQYFLALSDTRAYMAVLYLGILSSVLAFFLLNFSLAHIQVSQSAVFANLTTVISIVAGVLVLKEKFYWFQAVGAALIIAGVWGTIYFSADHNKSVRMGKDYINEMTVKKLGRTDDG
ncbi:MAG: DMT family transporter [Thermoanaerobacteraceae bacterium]|nr:DMT family transporter [Thermoanaerobacteraceae bacterium]